MNMKKKNVCLIEISKWEGIQQQWGGCPVRPRLKPKLGFDLNSFGTNATCTQYQPVQTYTLVPPLSLT